MFTDHPGMGLIDAPSAVIKDLKFQPAFHVRYLESRHHMSDNLLKFHNLTAEAGGSFKLAA